MTGVAIDSTTGAFRRAYRLSERVRYAAGAAVFALLFAGFWNSRLIDGFGRDVVVGRTLGDPDALSTAYGGNRLTFGGPMKRLTFVDDVCAPL